VVVLYYGEKSISKLRNAEKKLACGIGIFTISQLHQSGDWHSGIRVSQVVLLFTD
jgi:hypothetical protein